MGVLHVVKTGIIEALGGFPEWKVEEILAKANDLGDLSMKGKYGMVEALTIAARVRGFRTLTYNLFPGLAIKRGYVKSIERKRGVREVEIVKRERERGTPIPVDSIAHQARSFDMLAKVAGPPE